MKMILGVTGHRPKTMYPRMSFNQYMDDVHPMLIDFAEQFFSKYQEHIECVYTGMALGWDQAVAAACIRLGIPFRACIPFREQSSHWEEHQIREYRSLMVFAEKRYLISKGPYSPYVMQKRNEFIVDRCYILVPLFNGNKGGTANCVNYALRRSKQLDNVWDRWEQYRAESLLADLGF